MLASTRTPLCQLHFFFPYISVGTHFMRFMHSKHSQPLAVKWWSFHLPSFFFSTPEKWQVERLLSQIHHLLPNVCSYFRIKQEKQGQKFRLCTHQPTNLWNNSFPTCNPRTRAISRKPILWPAICYDYASCHTSDFTSMENKEEKAECKQKEKGRTRKTATRNGKIKQKYFG